MKQKKQQKPTKKALRYPKLKTTLQSRNFQKPLSSLQFPKWDW